MSATACQDGCGTSVVRRTSPHYMKTISFVLRLQQMDGRFEQPPSIPRANSRRADHSSLTTPTEVGSQSRNNHIDESRCLFSSRMDESSGNRRRCKRRNLIDAHSRSYDGRFSSGSLDGHSSLASAVPTYEYVTTPSNDAQQRRRAIKAGTSYPLHEGLAGTGLFQWG